MADPIARWRNPYFETVRELIDLLPRTEMDSDTARQQINELFGSDFFRTAYQVACQLGLYYERGDRFIPRFNHDPSAEEIYDYLRMWIKQYYVPNPYTRRGFDGLEPKSIHAAFCQLLIDRSSPVPLNEAIIAVFSEDIGNSDILRNTIATYSDVIYFNRENELSLKPGVKYSDLTSFNTQVTINDRNDKDEFFMVFNIDNIMPLIGVSTIDVVIPRNKIIYGAPGTGKSYELRDQARLTGFSEDDIIRVTFHPNYSYQQFVGSYKPTPIYKNVLQEGAVLYGSDRTTELQNNHKKEPLIDYSFIPGPLLKLLVKALNNSDKNYLLIIEEINRAPVSSVFGDVFQLLDRKEDGSSEYSITFNEEAMSFLRANGILNAEIQLPNNLFIWATMNSADQGVMPLDAAFKRRWAFEYLPLNEKQSKVENRKIKFQNVEYNWNDFRKQINDKLKDLGIVEDKLIGPFFMNSNELSDENSIKNKLLLYLRDDVVRHNPESLFKKKTYSDIIEMYSNGDNIFVNLEIKNETPNSDAGVVQE